MPNPLSSALQWGQKPLVPSSAIAGLQQSLDPVERPGQNEEGGGMSDYVNAARAIPDVARGMWNHPSETLGGFEAGALEGARRQTSPINLASDAMTAVGAGGMAKGALVANTDRWLMRQGLKAAAPALTSAEEMAASAKGAAEGTGFNSFAEGAGGERAPLTRSAGVRMSQEDVPRYPGDHRGLGLGPGAFRTPKAGGVLSNVLERAAVKSGTGAAGASAGVGGEMTPGEARLLEHYSRMMAPR